MELNVNERLAVEMLRSNPHLQTTIAKFVREIIPMLDFEPNENQTDLEDRMLDATNCVQWLANLFMDEEA